MNISRFAWNMLNSMRLYILVFVEEQIIVLKKIGNLHLMGYCILFQFFYLGC